MGEKEKGFRAENQGEEKHRCGVEYSSAPLTDEIREFSFLEATNLTQLHTRLQQGLGENSELPSPRPKHSPLPHSPSYNWRAGQARPGKAAERRRWGGRWPLPQVGAQRSQQPRAAGGRGRGGGQTKGRGEGRGLHSGAGQGTRAAARARAHARLPWGGGCRHCDRCWRCCCCCRGRFPGRTARSPAAARPTAPCAAPARGPASPDCEYAAPRPGTLARSGPPCLPTLWPPLPGSLEKTASPYQIPPPFKVVRRQSLGTVFAIPRGALDGGPACGRTLQPLATPGPRFPDFPRRGCGKGRGIAQKPRGKACSRLLLEGDRA